MEYIDKKKRLNIQLSFRIKLTETVNKSEKVKSIK